MNLRLFGAMFALMFPPRASADDVALLAAVERNTAASKDVVEKAANIERALGNIQEAGEGLFA